MGRIIEQNGTLVREVIAPRIEIFWTRGDEGSVVFQYHEVVTLDGEQLVVQPKKTLAMALKDLLPRSFPVTLPDGTVQEVPIMLVMGAIKSAVDILWDENVDNPGP